MKIICVVCELWLVEVLSIGGEVSYWCERCAHDTKIADSEQGDLRPFIFEKGCNSCCIPSGAVEQVSSLPCTPVGMALKTL